MQRIGNVTSSTHDVLDARQREEERRALWEIVASCPPCTRRILEALQEPRTFEQLREDLK